MTLTHPMRFTIKIEPHLRELRRLRRLLYIYLHETPALMRLDEILLVVSEAAQNTIAHGFVNAHLQTIGEINIEGILYDDHLDITICDNAPPLSLKNLKPRALDDIRVGGLGTYFIDRLAARADYSYAQAQNRLRLIFHL